MSASLPSFDYSRFKARGRYFIDLLRYAFWHEALFTSADAALFRRHIAAYFTFTGATMASGHCQIWFEDFSHALGGRMMFLFLFCAFWRRAASASDKEADDFLWYGLGLRFSGLARIGEREEDEHRLLNTAARRCASISLKMPHLAQPQIFSAYQA